MSKDQVVTEWLPIAETDPDKVIEKWVPLTQSAEQQDDQYSEPRDVLAVHLANIQEQLEQFPDHLIQEMPTSSLPSETEYPLSQDTDELIKRLVLEASHVMAASHEDQAVSDANARNILKARQGRLQLSSGQFLHGMPERHILNKSDGMLSSEYYGIQDTDNVHNWRVYISMLGDTSESNTGDPPSEILSDYTFSGYSNPDKDNVTVLLTDQSYRNTVPSIGSTNSEKKYVAVPFRFLLVYRLRILKA